ncbi:MAG: hypothetical protein BWY72_01985 [Bacteroidetes bacterium ADurb.Bin416]|nr:MAG: hypothetical protein BWY72_01985 [Bacteroidetes bacterium ADurb.Bin416]
MHFIKTLGVLQPGVSRKAIVAVDLITDGVLRITVAFQEASGYSQVGAIQVFFVFKHVVVELRRQRQILVDGPGWFKTQVEVMLPGIVQRLFYETGWVAYAKFVGVSVGDCLNAIIREGMGA